MEEILIIFSIRIQMYCKEKGITPEELAKMAGITQEKMDCIIKAECDTAMDDFQKIADALGVEGFQLILPPSSSYIHLNENRKENL